MMTCISWYMYSLYVSLIEPCTDDEAIDTILVNRQCKDDAEFIKVNEDQEENVAI